jgi:hypothetical protein
MKEKRMKGKFPSKARPEIPLPAYLFMGPVTGIAPA